MKATDGKSPRTTPNLFTAELIRAQSQCDRLTQGSVINFRVRGRLLSTRHIVSKILPIWRPESKCSCASAASSNL